MILLFCWDWWDLRLKAIRREIGVAACAIGGLDLRVGCYLGGGKLVFIDYLFSYLVIDATKVLPWCYNCRYG